MMCPHACFILCQGASLILMTKSLVPFGEEERREEKRSSLKLFLLAVFLWTFILCKSYPRWSSRAFIGPQCVPGSCQPIFKLFLMLQRAILLASNIIKTAHNHRDRRDSKGPVTNPKWHKSTSQVAEAAGTHNVWISDIPFRHSASGSFYSCWMCFIAYVSVHGFRTATDNIFGEKNIGQIFLCKNSYQACAKAKILYKHLHKKTLIKFM